MTRRKGHTEQINCLAFGQDGDRLASGSGEPARVSNDSRGSLIPEKPGVVNVWHMTSERVTSLGGATVILSVAFAPDGKRLVAAVGVFGESGPFEVRLWDVDTGREIMSLGRHTGSVRAVAFSQGGQRIASASLISSGNIQIWDATPLPPEKLASH